MISLTKALLIMAIFTKILAVASQERCISKFFVRKESLVFTCDFQNRNENLDTFANEYKCVHFHGLPNTKACGEIGLRFKFYPHENVNSSISLRYFSNRDVKNEIIEVDCKSGWQYWSKVICADFMNSVSHVFEVDKN